jgi:tyrosyl-tRNA synthetase
VGQPDSDVERLLKLFTFRPLSHIEEVMAEHNAKPEKRIAQHLLAHEFVTLVHGSDEAELAQKQHQSLFSKTTLNSLPAGWEEQPSYTLLQSRMADTPVPAVLTAAGLSASKSQASRLIQSGGAYIYRSATFNPIKDAPKFFDESDLVPGQDGGKFLILRSGKQKVRVVKVIGDEGL